MILEIMQKGGERGTLVFSVEKAGADARDTNLKQFRKFYFAEVFR
jgi:hypothetical protein